MEIKYKAVRQRLKEHMEDLNGKDCWNEYYGSSLEADIVRFVEKEVKKLNIDNGSDSCEHDYIEIPYGSTGVIFKCKKCQNTM